MARTLLLDTAPLRLSFVSSLLSHLDGVALLAARVVCDLLETEDAVVDGGVAVPCGGGKHEGGPQQGQVRAQVLLHFLLLHVHVSVLRVAVLR
eukprot:2582393-Pyramimonas_sp.AAC.1